MENVMVFRDQVTEKFNGVVEAMTRNDADKAEKFDLFLGFIMESFPMPEDQKTIDEFVVEADFFLGSKPPNLPTNPSDFPSEYSDLVYSLYLVWVIVRIKGMLPQPMSKAFQEFAYQFRNVLIARVK